MNIKLVFGFKTIPFWTIARPDNYSPTKSPRDNYAPCQSPPRQSPQTIVPCANLPMDSFPI